MPQITRLKAQKNAKKVNLYIDHQFVAGLSLDLVVKHGLAVGQTLSVKQLAALTGQAIEEKLYHQCLNFLSFRPRSPKEVDRFLAKKTTANPKFKPVLQSVKTKLEQKGLVNQQEFAQWWLEQRLRFRPKGKLALKQELRQKGIELSIIEQVLAKIDETQVIQDFYQRQLRKKTSLITDSRRLTAFLQRRGFSWESIKAFIDALSKKD